MPKLEKSHFRTLFYLALGLPNLLPGLLFFYFQLFAVVFLLRFFYLYDGFTQETTLSFLPVFVLFILATLFHFVLFYFISIKRQLGWLFVTPVAYILTFFFGVISWIFISFPGWNPTDQFQFAARCEEMNQQQITPEIIKNLHGYCREGSNNVRWTTHLCTFEEVEMLQRVHTQCVQPLPAGVRNRTEKKNTEKPNEESQFDQCVKNILPANATSSFIHQRFGLDLRIWHVDSSQPQIYCELHPTDTGITSSIGTYFD